MSTLSDNTTGSRNTANGEFALGSNTTGSDNTATGAEALYNNTTGADNTATGALRSRTTPLASRTQLPGAALLNSNGDNNTAIGTAALSNNIPVTAISPWASAGSGVSTASSVIAIGIAAENVSNSCYIGQIYSNVQPVVGPIPMSLP